MITSLSKLIPTKKSNPCPVCGNVSGKCRTFDDKPLVLCMMAESAPGFKALGFTKDGLWMQFAPDSQSFDHAAYLDRKREKPEPPETMPIDERDQSYRDWLANGSLNERDRADLIRRGLSNSEIAVSSKIGYAVPFKGLDGKYVGAQWRLADPGEGGRYRWHNLKGGKYYPGTDELPIAVYKVENPTAIALVEGTGIKPLLASQRLNAVVIGAAGGNHASSPIQLRAAIEAFPNLPIVIVPDAGDVLNSHVMRRNDRTVETLRQWELEPKFLWWNQRTKQENDIDEATQAEIESAQLLTHEQFTALTEEHDDQAERSKIIQAILEACYVQNGSRHRTSESVQSSEKRQKGRGEQGRNDKTSNELAKTGRNFYRSRSSEIHRSLVSAIQKVSRRSDAGNTPHSEGFAKMEYGAVLRRLRTFSIDALKFVQNVVSEQPNRDRLISKRVFRFRQYQDKLQRDFLMPTLVNGNEIRYQNYSGSTSTFDLFDDTTCLQGWLGAGKTEAMLKSLIPFQDKAIVWVAPRNGLLRQTAQRAKKLGFNVFHYQDDPGKHRMMLEAGEPGIYFMAPDSFKSYAVSGIQWENTIFAIDEFSGIRKEVLGKTTELPQFLDAIARCASLIAADAFLSQIDIRVIQKHRSGSMQILRQDFKKSQTRIKWLECRNKAGEISFSHLGIYYSLLDRWIEQGFKRIAIAADSIRVAKLLDRYLKSKGVKTQLVCSETPEQNVSFMDDPDKIIHKDEIEAIVYTPTAQSGLDIQAEFDRGLLIATGVLSPLQMLQMMGRCRKCPEWYVSAPRFSGNPECVTPSLDGRKIQQWSEKIALASEALEFNAPQSIQPWAVWEHLTRNIEQAFNSEYLRHLLDRFFESVEVVEVENDRAGQWRRDSEILTREEKELMLKANLGKGLRLIDEQKQPKLNSEVWDIKLAELWLKYPKVINKAIADYGVPEWRDDAIDMTKLFSTRRIEKLRNYVIATEPNEQDDRDLRQYLKERVTHYSAGNFKRLQNVKLFRLLNLGKLATVQNPKELKAGVNAFCATSEAIEKLYRKFLNSPELVKLFPFVECQRSFFGAVKACLSYLGYEKGGKSIRVATDELNPNGCDRNGNQRLTKSKSIYLVYWLVMECSGSAYFREHFNLIIDAIRDRLETEREERRKWREKHESPPIEIAA
ncbi:DEAD/DEAH box helicase family protein [Leptolyngbya sp. NIES-2104]|uniref:DEAD/DEAH box helicase family protein n=1 Tax=Leptolyngbya sp. NIES-2104 TaxID=1552121 RepID=UPI0006EC8A7D|nr:DEAD/DEAH box helicase family protein [Leptolyngbya sp. NIES-2104]GAP96115.1 DNA primase [Leptolyngbya sp. NIES-2104]